MQAIQPEQASFLLQYTLPNLKNEHQTTKRMFEAIPLDKGDYRPDRISRSAIELAWHIAVAENRFLDAVASGEFHFGDSTRPEHIRNSSDVARWYDETFDTNLKRLNELSGDQLAKIVDFRGVFQLPAVSFLNFVICHTIHHRGQLSTYMRPMGVKVPSIYGESYDDAQARLAAAKA
jgi:uncharacterized damage-inducible protein DinB